MGKKRIVKKGGEGESGAKAASVSKLAKKKLVNGLLHIESTFNNTKVLLTDQAGDAVCWSSSGSLGFKGAKKGTPFAAEKVGEVVGDKAKLIGIREVEVIIKGVGAGRESSLRAFAAKGIAVTSIKDQTPYPFNGPTVRRPRRV